MNLKKFKLPKKILSLVRLGVMILVVVFMIGAVGKLLYPLFFTVEPPPQVKFEKPKYSSSKETKFDKSSEESKETHAVSPKTQWAGTSLSIALNDLDVENTVDTSQLKRGDSVLILQKITFGSKSEVCGLGLFGFEKSFVTALNFVAFDAQKSSKMELVAKYLKTPLRYMVIPHNAETLKEQHESCQNWILTEKPKGMESFFEPQTLSSANGSAHAEMLPPETDVSPLKIKQGSCRKVSTNRYLMFIPPQNEKWVAFRPNVATAGSWELCGEGVGSGKIITLSRKQGSLTFIPLEVTAPTASKGKKSVPSAKSPQKPPQPKVYSGWAEE